MKLSLLVIFLSLISGAAWTQPEASPRDAASQAVSERRAELREVLKSQRGSESGSLQREVPASSAKRQLLVQERSDLRQQLRQQHPEIRPKSP